MYARLQMGLTMTTLSVRLSNELDRALPGKRRSAWVLSAIRQRLRQEQIEATGRSAARHEGEELETLRDWEPAGRPLTKRRIPAGRR